MYDRRWTGRRQYLMGLAKFGGELISKAAHLLVFIQVLHKVQVSHSCTLFLVDLLGFECDWQWLLWLCCKCVEFYWGYFVTFCFSCCSQCFQSFSQALIKSIDAALWPVEMFISSCSSYLNGLIIWWLITSVVFFTLSTSFTHWLLESLLSELEELATISPWLLVPDWCQWRVLSWHHGCTFSRVPCLSRYHWNDLLFDVQWTVQPWMHCKSTEPV